MGNRFAIVENGYVINVAVSDAPLGDNWIESETAQINNQYIDGEFVVSEIQIQQQIAANKAMAQSLLAATDWAATVDINNPQYSNPYLANQDEFLAYRSQVRAIAVDTPTVVSSWPSQPDPVWNPA